MPTDSKALRWRYFLALDKDVSSILRYIELDERNFKTFSIENVRLLLVISSEVEIVCKQLCQKINNDESVNHYDLPGLIEIMLGEFPKIHDTVINVPRARLNIKPWEDISKTYVDDNTKKEVIRSPPWWQAYNNVKHQRHQNYERANLRNVLYALPGLFTTLLVLVRLPG